MHALVDNVACAPSTSAAKVAQLKKIIGRIDANANGTHAMLVRAQTSQRRGNGAGRGLKKDAILNL